jgi:hypothetical protein
MCLVYGWCSSVLYDFTITIELVVKVYRPSQKHYLIPLWMYHVAYQSIAVALSVLHITLEGPPPWNDVYGCSLSTSATFR